MLVLRRDGLFVGFILLQRRSLVRRKDLTRSVHYMDPAAIVRRQPADSDICRAAGLA